MVSRPQKPMPPEELDDEEFSVMSSSLKKVGPFSVPSLGRSGGFQFSEHARIGDISHIAGTRLGLEFRIELGCCVRIADPSNGRMALVINTERRESVGIQRPFDN